MILSRLVPKGYLPPSEAEKIDFSSIWLNWNSNIQPNVPVKKGSEIYLKAPKLFIKTYFQIS